MQTGLNQEKETAFLIAVEKDTLKAFKAKDEKAFTQHFAADYIGVAADGMKDAAGELKGMHKLDLDSLSMEDEKVSFPADGTAVITYTMPAEGKMSGKPFKGKVYCATVYLKRGEAWEVVLHTESMAG